MSACVRKQVVLIRHAESRGQKAKERKTDQSLTDCLLSRNGYHQASHLRKQWRWDADLIVVSPLSRAIVTACIGLQQCKRFGASEAHPGGAETNGEANDADPRETTPQHGSGPTATDPSLIPMVCHPCLKELGSDIPENRARDIRTLKRDPDVSQYPRFGDIDFSMLGDAWPSAHPFAHATGVAGPEAFVRWLEARPETRIIVVTHHNIIQTLLRDRHSGRIKNASPISCVLEGGSIRPVPMEEFQAIDGAPRSTDGPFSPVAFQPGSRDTTQTSSASHAQAAGGGTTPVRSLRLGFLSHREQKKPKSAMKVENTPESIIAAALRKTKGLKSKLKGADQAAMVFVGDDGRTRFEGWFDRRSKAPIENIQDGDSVFVTRPTGS